MDLNMFNDGPPARRSVTVVDDQLLHWLVQVFWTPFGCWFETGERGGFEPKENDAAWFPTPTAPVARANTGQGL